MRRFPRALVDPGGRARRPASPRVFTWVGPVVLAPIFNKFEPLPDGSEARAEVLELGRARRRRDRPGLPDRRQPPRRPRSTPTSTASARRKRVVLYDNLLERAKRPELRSIVAHELGHVAHDDIRRGLTFVAIVAPLGLLFARELALAHRAPHRRRPALAGGGARVPAGAHARGLRPQHPRQPALAQGRGSADEFALELTDDPEALIDVQRELARTNISDPDPPGLYSALFGTHPTTVERIGAALEWERR